MEGLASMTNNDHIGSKLFGGKKLSDELELHQNRASAGFDL